MSTSQGTPTPDGAVTEHGEQPILTPERRRFMAQPMAHKVEVRGLYHLTECIVVAHPEYADDACSCLDQHPEWSAP